MNRIFLVAAIATVAILIIGAGIIYFDRTNNISETRGMVQDLVSKSIKLYDEKGTAAFSIINDSPKFLGKQLYVYVFRDSDGIIVAHGVDKSLIGKNMDDLLDVNGDNIGKYVIHDSATKEGVWVEYLWEDPETQKILPKSVWLVIHDGYIFASGIYATDNISVYAPLNIPVKTAETLSGEVKIGLILPLSGDLASHGNENWEGSKFAVTEFNKYLKEIKAPWHLTMVSEDSATNPVVALEKLSSLKAKGIDLVVGPETSSNVRSLKGYSDSNNMLLFSCCSTAPSLAINDDSIYRLTPNDTFQGTALSKIITNDNIEVLVPMWRADAWGDGLQDSTAKSFEKRGGIVGEGVRYNPESPEFSAAASLLSKQVQDYVDEYGADKVGVLFIGYAETVHFMQSASQYEILDDVRWYGGDSNVKEPRLVNDPIAAKFANSVSFTASQFSVATNPTHDKVDVHVSEKLGRSAYAYVHSSYDIVWILGLSILDTQSTDVDLIKKVIPRIAENYKGAIGTIKLNDAGDLDGVDYGIWVIQDGKWISGGIYDHILDTIK